MTDPAVADTTGPPGGAFGGAVDPFRRLAEVMPDGLMRLGLDGTILYCNPSFTKMYGLQPSDLIGHRIRDLATPDRADLVDETIAQVVATRAVTDSAHMMAEPGSAVEIESRSVPELGADGEVESILVVVRDVTLLRTALRELNESEERFEMLVRYSSDIITVLEPDGAWRYSSPGGARLLGFPEGYDPEGGIFSLLHPDEVGRATELLADIQADGVLRPDPIEFRIVDASGKERILESVVQNLVDNPAVNGIVINSRDVTERRRAEQSIRLSEASLRSLADAVPVGIFDVGIDGTRNFENRYMQELQGQGPSAGRGIEDPIAVWRDLVHPEDHDLVRDAFVEAVSTRSMVKIRHRLAPRDDEPDAWVELRLAPVLDNDRQVARILGSIADVSAAVETEERLAAARDAAVEASRLKSQFLANISHEIRTPLNAILGMAALLLDEDLNPEQVDRVVTLRSAGTQLLELLQDVLDLSRIEADQLQLDRVPVDLRQVVSDAVGLFSAAAHEQGIGLRLEGADLALPAVLGDALRLRQILVNLVGNAVKFTEHGSVTVKVGLTRRGATGVAVRFEVADTGPGISPGMQDGLFEPFRQGDESTTRRHGGTGLGLAITRELAELMGGTISLVSEVGQGSRFIVTIPFDTATQGARQPLPGRQMTGGASRAAGSHVLVVEDNDVNRQVVTAYLKKLGCAYEAVTDGSDAVEVMAARGDEFDIVLMDCQMPEMDGFEATRRIRDQERVTGRRRVPIVAVTAGALHDERERCIECGMDDYLAKPFTLAALEQVLLVDRSRSGTRRVTSAPDHLAADHDVAEREEAVQLVRGLMPERLLSLQRAIVNGTRAAALDAIADIVAAAEAVEGAALIESASELRSAVTAPAPRLQLAAAFDLVERAWRNLDAKLSAAPRPTS